MTWINPYKDITGQIHSSERKGFEHIPNEEVEGNILWRLDSSGVTFWIAESCGEFYWQYDHKIREARLDSDNPTSGWNFKSEVDSDWTPIVFGEKFILPQTMKRHFRPDSAGVGYLILRTTVVPFDIEPDPNFGFRPQE